MRGHKENESVGALHRARDQRTACDELRVGSPIVSDKLIREQQFPINQRPSDCRCGIGHDRRGKCDQYVLQERIDRDLQ